MCGRFAQTEIKQADLDAVLAVAGVPSPRRSPIQASVRASASRAEIRPGESTLVLVKDLAGDTVGVPASWGVRSKRSASPRGLINARAERLIAARTWNQSAAWQPCLVLASSFFEWGGEPGHRIRYRVRPAAPTSCMVMAGIAQASEATTVDHHALNFVILTMPSAPPLHPIHDRMPAMLDGGDLSRWLHAPDPWDTALLQSLLRAPESYPLRLDAESQRADADRSGKGPPRAQPEYVPDDGARQLGLFSGK